MISGPGMKIIPAVQAQAITPDSDISHCFAPRHACSGGSLADLELTQAECLLECRARADCLCISWGVVPSKKCRLENGTFHNDRGNNQYSAMMQNAPCTPINPPIDSALAGGGKNIEFAFAFPHILCKLKLRTTA